MFARRSLRLLASLLLVVAGILAARDGRADDTRFGGPRDFDATGFGASVALGPDWLFMPGDDPAWAAAALDDRGWKFVSTQRQLADYGIHDLRFGWYRMHVRVRPGARGVAVGLRAIRGSYEVYANGVRIGGEGPVSGEVEYTKPGLAVDRVPDGLIPQNGELTLAIRVAFNATGSLGRGLSTPITDDSVVSLIDERSAPHEAAYINMQNIGDSLVMASLTLLVCVVAFALFGAMRTRYEYLAAGVALLADCLELSTIIWNALQASTLSSAVVRYFFLAVGNVALIEFVRMVVRQRRTRGLFILEAVSGVTTFFALAAIAGYGPVYLAFACFFLPQLLAAGVMTGLLVRGSLRGILEARVLLPSVLILALARLLDFVRLLVLFTHLSPRPLQLPVFAVGLFVVDIFSISEFLFYITVLLFLVIRTVGIARERQRIAGELEAARTIQQLLLAGDAQATPGFVVESVYYPANEVGGDFFLVQTNTAGALLVVVGDVSGKGLQAAMRVSMILGVLRREYSWEPGVVLANLNEALQNSGQSGFTTACCVRIDADGRGSLANAGHIAPYLDGAEVVTAPALPLGLAEGVEYEQIGLVFEVGQRLVLMSDGVVEARAAGGELLGFQRVAELSRLAAAEIADAAKSFGQDDDITVLTIMRQTE
jgi:sigma-B regulation protein RsbU (phosphoserine phosphatase)